MTQTVFRSITINIVLCWYYQLAHTRTVNLIFSGVTMDTGISGLEICLLDYILYWPAQKSAIGIGIALDFLTISLIDVAGITLIQSISIVTTKGHFLDIKHTWNVKVIADTINKKIQVISSCNFIQWHYNKYVMVIYSQLSDCRDSSDTCTSHLIPKDSCDDPNVRVLCKQSCHFCNG